MSYSNWCFPNLSPVKGIEYFLSDFNQQQLARKCMEKSHNWKVFFYFEIMKRLDA